MASSHTSSPAGPKSVRGALCSPQPGWGFPHSDPVVKGTWQKARVPPAAGTVPPWRLTSIRSAAQTHWNSVSSCWGLERVSHPSQPVTSGLLPAPSHGSLKSRAHPWITILRQAPLGASTTPSFTASFPAQRQSVLPPPGRASGRWVSQAVHHAFFQQQ